MVVILRARFKKANINSGYRGKAPKAKNLIALLIFYFMLCLLERPMVPKCISELFNLIELELRQISEGDWIFVIGHLSC